MRVRAEFTTEPFVGEGEMPEHDAPMSITRITLRPQIVVREDVGEARVRHLVEVAHRECFIANSLHTDVVVEPDISIVD